MPDRSGWTFMSMRVATHSKGQGTVKQQDTTVNHLDIRTTAIVKPEEIILPLQLRKRMLFQL